MDEDEEASRRRQQEKARKRAPQYTYKDVLQQVSDRKLDEICIDLDDLASVGHSTSIRELLLTSSLLV